MPKISSLPGLLQRCRYELNLDRRVEMLFQINSFLPSRMQLKLPSFITDDYITRALDTIEEKLVAQ